MSDQRPDPIEEREQDPPQEPDVRPAVVPAGPERHQVRVRRSPKIGVFLALGALVGVMVALVAVLATPPDPTTPTVQVLGFFVLLLAPAGALVAGTIAVVLEARAVRRARTVDAHRERAALRPNEED